METFNLEAEKAVIGSILINPALVFDIQQVIDTIDFQLEKHQHIYNVCLHLTNEQKKIDTLTVADELQRRNQLQSIGKEYLGELYLTTPTEHHALHYAEIVERLGFSRRLKAAAHQIAVIASLDDERTPDEKRQQAESLILAVCRKRESRDLRLLKDIVSQAYDEIEERSKGNVTGVMSGFKALDKITGGFQKSDLWYIAGRPGMGKSSLMLDIAYNAANSYDCCIALFSLEMSDIQLANRMLAKESLIDSNRLRLGKLQDDEWTQFIQSANSLSPLQIWIDDTPAISSSQVRAKLRRLQIKAEIHLVIIDYLQLMQTDTKYHNRVAEFTQLSAQLKSLAREFNLPFLVGCQLSRAVEQRKDKRPILSDLRESGGLEQDADGVIAIYRDGYYNEESDQPNVAEILIRKHRNGPTGMFPLYFKKELTTFVNVEMFQQDLES